MPNRDEFLQSKATQIQADLERWAETERILGPQEQVVFTLAIRNISTVIQEVASTHFLDMSLQDFFTKGRFIDAGVPVRRRFSAISSLWSPFEKRVPSIPTIRDLLLLRKDGLRKIRNNRIGHRTIEAMAQVLAHNGITLPD
ncbi:MAG: hypothetical protein AAB691_02115 [Patescibacteria group bacterium]